MIQHKSNQVYEILREASEILNSVPELWKQTCEGMKHADLELSDILHELELGDFDEKKGHELACEIKRIRQRRRTIKEDQNAFASLKDFYEKNGTYIKRLEEVVSLIQKEIDARSKRIYTPKIRIDKMSPIYAENAIREEAKEELQLPEEEIQFIEAQPV